MKKGKIIYVKVPPGADASVYKSGQVFRALFKSDNWIELDRNDGTGYYYGHWLRGSGDIQGLDWLPVTKAEYLFYKRFGCVPSENVKKVLEKVDG